MSRRTVLTVTIAFAVLLAPATAQATSVLGTGGTAIPCAAQSDGVRFCQGSTVPSTPSVSNPTGAAHPETSWDGTTIDVNVTLPPAPASGSDGNYPLVIIGHGYGGHKQGLDGREAPWLPTAHELALKGYAVLNATDRGFGDSCGSPASRAANPTGCAQGWVHLMDPRYEVRDAQFMAGQLADEGLANPRRIGAIGESYGGGESLLLGTLKDRVFDASTNKLVPWTSPQKKLPMSIAAATPTIPWSDLISSLVPNGHGLTYTVTQPTADFTPAGVEKQSFVEGLYLLGTLSGYYAPPGADPNADLTTWNTVTNTSPDPYESNPMFGSIIDQFKYRGAFYILDGTTIGGRDTEAPAPMLLSSGYTDDLFPVDETVRFYNLEKSLFPNDPIALTYMDYGHMRGQNKTADTIMLRGQIQAWLDHYVLGTGPDPGHPVTALTQTCPSSAASGGPFTAETFIGLEPGVLPFVDFKAQTILSTAGDPAIAKAIDPVAGGGACATTGSADQPNVATYRLPAVRGNGYTMLGAPTIFAKLSVSGSTGEIAMRLWDVAPDGTQTLVDRGDYRPPSDTSQVQIFQLHAGAWHFAAGHVPKLELLGQDPPYVRTATGAFTVTVSALGLILPTHETSGNGIHPLSGLPAPSGAQPAPGVTLFTPQTVAVAVTCTGAKAKRATASAAKHGRSKNKRGEKKTATRRGCRAPAKRHSRAKHHAKGRKR